jgi:hypothetical protein
MRDPVLSITDRLPSPTGSHQVKGRASRIRTVLIRTLQLPWLSLPLGRRIGFNLALSKGRSASSYKDSPNPNFAAALVVSLYRCGIPPVGRIPWLPFSSANSNCQSQERKCAGTRHPEDETDRDPLE